MFKAGVWITIQSKTLETKILNKFKTSPSFLNIERMLLKDCVICWHDFGKVLEFDENIYKTNKQRVIAEFLNKGEK